ncbi:MAG TPA: MBL fold metallo-hydrolase, partial [Pirellulales bacterium]|nr:MBL fold metallo-hydrolase [Pirellulales bacterium]
MHVFKHGLAFLLCLVAAGDAQPSEKPALAARPPRSKLRVASEAWPEVFRYADTCNVYVLRDGNSALLVNLGDGDVLDHLAEIGVSDVDWIVFTDHHREQCQGVRRIDRARTKLAAPKDEQALFETPRDFRKWRPSLNDTYTVHGASYVRPPAETIKLDRLLVDGEVFEWHGRRITCLATPGHSPGGMSYLLKDGDRTCAFTGGIMHDGARLTNWFDT